MKRQQRLWTTNSGGRVSGRGLVRYRLAAAGLLFLLLLSGCVSSIETKISVGANGAWSGELRLLFAPPLAVASERGNALDVQVQEQVEALLGGRGIRYSWERASALDGSAVYTCRLQGRDLHALAEVMLAEDTVGVWLNGPVVLDMQGNVQTGQGLEIALPARPSTGYSWAVKATSGGLSQVGAVESRQVQPGLGTLSRQVVRFQAATAGPAGFQLLYRRPWMADATPTRVLSLRVSVMDLAAACAALSMPATPLPAPAGVPVLRANAGVVAPSAQPPAVLQAAYNWCDHSGCTPIKDQGLCGSCWTFGTVGPLESNILIHDGQTTDLSEQYLLSCNVEGWNCDGGWFAHDYHLSLIPPGETQAGAVPEAEMPYQADDTVPCNPPHNHPYRITSWAYVGDDESVPSVSAIKQAMLSHGPIATAICIGTAFQDYTGGVFETDESAECPDPSFVNHAIVLVGWDDSQGTSGVWILRNSWNTDWGESGYMRIGYGTSRVGFGANYVVYTPAVPPTNWVYLPLLLRDYNPAVVPTTYDVLLLSPDTSEGDITGLLAALHQYPSLQVTSWDNASGNPTLGDLQPYDVVIVGNDITWEEASLDKTVIGNVLADYIDAGGKVIESIYVQSYDEWGFAGRYMTAGYSPFSPATLDFWDSDSMTILQPAHPVMAGVSSISDSWGHQNPGLRAGAQLLAQWGSSGYSAVAVNNNVVALNQLIFYQAAWGGNVPRLLYNAIVWLAGN